MDTSPDRAGGISSGNTSAAHEPEYAGTLDTIDARTLEPDYYRACVRRGDGRRWLCLFVKPDRRPVAVVPDPDRTRN